ncbi:hypothetical protein D3C71_2029890 [compost metagenome]
MKRGGDLPIQAIQHQGLRDGEAGLAQIFLLRLQRPIGYCRIQRQAPGNVMSNYAYRIQ